MLEVCMISIKSVSDLQNNNELLPDAADESHVSLIKILLAELKKGEDSAAKNGYGDMVLMSMETYEKNLFLANVYGKLEEAKQNMKNGKYSSVEDAVARIRKSHGL